MEMNEKEAQAVGDAAQATSLLDTLLESTKIRPGDESYSITKQGIQTFIGNLLEGNRAVDRVTAAKLIREKL